MDWKAYEDRLFAEELKRLESAMGPNALPKGALRATPALEMPGAQFDCNGPQGPQGSQGFQGPQGYQCGPQAFCFGAQGSQGPQGLDLVPPDFASPCFPGTTGPAATADGFVVPTAPLGFAGSAYFWSGILITVGPGSSANDVTFVKPIIIKQRTVVPGNEPSPLLILQHVYLAKYIGTVPVSGVATDFYGVGTLGGGGGSSGYTGEQTVEATSSCTGGSLSVAFVTNTYIAGALQ